MVVPPLRYALLSAILFGVISAMGVLQAQRNLAAIASSGAVSQERLKSSPAQWDVKARTGTGAQFSLRVVSSPPDFEVRILLKPETKDPQPFARIISHSGKWYVEEFGGLKGVYLPWEAPFSFEAVALLLSEAWPSAYELQDGHRHEHTRNRITTVRAPLTGGQRELAEAFLKEAAEFRLKPTGELELNIKGIRQRLREGNILKVDALTGLLRGLSLGNLELEYGKVNWLRKRPEIPVLNHLPDFSAPIPGERDDLIMIGHAGGWRPGNPAMDPGGRLLNLKNGKLLRIPFIGSSCMPGCFVANRTKVAVTARDTSGSGVGLYLIDLATGAHERLGGKTLATGMCHGPVLSPDGKTLALTRSTRILERQLYLLDLEGGEARAVGKPMDAHGFDWLADGSGLIGIIKHSKAVEEVPEFRIARFGLDGSITVLRKDIGNFAVVVGAQRDRIFFQEKDNAWHTCDLEGEDVKKVGDGLSRLTFPSVSPDGRRVVMLEHEEAVGTWPVVVDLATGEAVKAKADPGLWITPAWR
jgi:hypothetical protein